MLIATPNERLNYSLSISIEGTDTWYLCKFQASSRHKVHAAPEQTMRKIFQTTEHSVAFMNESFFNSRRIL